MHDQAERAVGQVPGADGGEHGAGRHVVKGDLAALDELVAEEESQSDAHSVRAVRSVGIGRHRPCAVTVRGQRVERLEAQL